MYTCKLFSVYLRDHEHTSDFQKDFSLLTFEKVYLPVSRFSNKNGNTYLASPKKPDVWFDVS